MVDEKGFFPRLMGLKRPILGLLALFLFVMAVQILKEGARALAPYLRSSWVQTTLSMPSAWVGSPPV